MIKKPFFKPPFKSGTNSNSNNNNKPQQNYQKNKFPYKKDDGGYRINRNILAKEVRLIQEDKEPIIISIYDAQKIADDSFLDLVEISPNATPPVCKILDFSKFLYDKKKKEKENTKSKGSVALKEIQLSPNIGEHDYLFKAKQAGEFLDKGHRVKVSMLFKGRMITHKEQGELLMLKFSQEITEFGKAESLPKHEGKMIIMYLVPKKK